MAFQTLLGASTMLAYLSMMAPRLVELHRVLKPTGSLYLHCDPTASHYLKLLLDAVFGARHISATRSSGSVRRAWRVNAAASPGKRHDLVLCLRSISQPAHLQRPDTARCQQSTAR